MQNYLKNAKMKSKEITKLPFLYNYIKSYISTNIDDHNISDKKKYTNTILEHVNSFKTYINSENYIRCGKLKKNYVNLSGFIIKKKTITVISLVLALWILMCHLP
ncbi:hypothetical protein YYC_02782 [Plasmodium yoelii 17X]|uniref:Uncharacterized protein n=1 Tax=Plasmodium yoelii 17X TaxID=1323249 RepID=V7PP01_PLAYE|nr:hypothetical protein YYC_02782 [Plasmodium yoelii 17X]